MLLSHIGIHIFDLPSLDLSLSDVIKYLSSEEQVVMNEFTKDARKMRFAFSRYYLKNLITQYLGIKTEDVVIKTDRNGKPFLVGKALYPLHFSISYCQGFIVIGVSSSSIGVDIESVKCFSFWKQTVNDFLTEYERAVFEGLPLGSQKDFFMTAWVGKEAYTKAIGGSIFKTYKYISILPSQQMPININYEKDYVLKLFKIKNVGLIAVSSFFASEIKMYTSRGDVSVKRNDMKILLHDIKIGGGVKLES